MATARVSESQWVSAGHFVSWLRTANGECDCEDTCCAAGGRFLGNPRDACIVLFQGSLVEKGECHLGTGEPNDSVPEISTEHQGLLVL